MSVTKRFHLDEFLTRVVSIYSSNPSQASNGGITTGLTEKFVAVRCSFHPLSGDKRIVNAQPQIVADLMFLTTEDLTGSGAEDGVANGDVVQDEATDLLYEVVYHERIETFLGSYQAVYLRRQEG